MSVKILEYKSIPENWELEESGKKANTLRKDEGMDDARNRILRWWSKGQQSVSIQITNTKTGEMFERIVTDISYWEGWWIISWNPNEKIKKKGG